MLQEKWCLTLTLTTLSNFSRQFALKSLEFEVRSYRLGRHISPLSDVLCRLLVGHAHSLLSPGHLECRGPRHGVVMIVLIEVGEQEDEILRVLHRQLPLIDDFEVGLGKGCWVTSGSAA